MRPRSSLESPTSLRSTRSRMRSRISLVVPDADIRADERVLELFEEIGVNSFASGDYVFDTGDEAFAGFLNAAF